MINDMFINSSLCFFGLQIKPLQIHCPNRSEIKFRVDQKLKVHEIITHLTEQAGKNWFTTYDS